LASGKPSNVVAMDAGVPGVLIRIAGLVYVTGGRGVRALIVFPAVTTVLLYVIFGLLLRVPL
jgi:hypothetical protein